MTEKVKGSGGEAAARKRSIARRFNDALAGKAAVTSSSDKRTTRKLDRYREELKNAGKAGARTLSALEIAKRVDALLAAGERLGDLRKLATPRQPNYEEAEMVALVSQMHAMYKFRADAYRFAGVRNETLLAAGVIAEIPKPRGPRKKS